MPDTEWQVCGRYGEGEEGEGGRFSTHSDSTFKAARASKRRTKTTKYQCENIEQSTEST